MKKIIIAVVLSLFSFASFADNTFVYSTKDISATMNGKTFKGKVGSQKVDCVAQNAEVKEKEIYFIYECKKPYTIAVVVDSESLNYVILLGKGDMRKAQQFPVSVTETTRVN